MVYGAAGQRMTGNAPIGTGPLCPRLRRVSVSTMFSRRCSAKPRRSGSSIMFSSARTARSTRISIPRPTRRTERHSQRQFLGINGDLSVASRVGTVSHRRQHRRIRRLYPQQIARHREHLEQIVISRAQHLPQLIRGRRRIEPGVPGTRIRKHDRHAVVDRRRDAVRFGGDEGVAQQGGARRRR